ncbi:hypothetical protein ERO13_A06G148150v2 [Gossypium hirsutum]|nr:hypothetical protein ERO13_A06G148150v2 [Gossypium hirsutum]
MSSLFGQEKCLPKCNPRWKKQLLLDKKEQKTIEISIPNSSKATLLSIKKIKTEKEKPKSL